MSTPLWAEFCPKQPGFASWKQINGLVGLLRKWMVLKWFNFFLRQINNYQEVLPSLESMYIRAQENNWKNPENLDDVHKNLLLPPGNFRGRHLSLQCQGYIFVCFLCLNARDQTHSWTCSLQLSYTPSPFILFLNSIIPRVASWTIPRVTWLWSHLSILSSAW